MPVTLKIELTCINIARWKSRNVFEETKHLKCTEVQRILLFYVKESFSIKLCILSIIYSCEFYHVVIGKNTTHALKSENQLCCVMESHRILESKQVHKEYIWVKNKKRSICQLCHFGVLFIFMQMKCSNYPVRKADKWKYDSIIFLLSSILQKHGRNCQQSPPKQIGTYALWLSVWINASLTTRCEITVNFEGISWAALVRINPIFTWK